MLTAFIVLQLVFDIVLLLLWAVGALRRRAAASTGDGPPDWYPQFVALAEEVLAVTEPVLDALEAGAPTPVRMEAPARREAPVERETTDPHREALALLRAGVDPVEVARRGGLLPGELALMKNIVTAETDRGQPRSE
jgi:hypothetical protein